MRPGPDLDVLVVALDDGRLEDGRLFGVQVDVDRPILFLLEPADVVFAVNDQAQRDGLDASGRQSTADFVPKQGRNLVTDQTIEYAAGLLGVHKVRIHWPGMVEGLLDGRSGDLVECDAEDFGGGAALGLKLFLQMSADGLTLAVRSAAR